MIHHVARNFGRAKHFLGQVDRGLHVASRAFSATKHLIPEGALKRAGERATMDYDQIKEKVRQASLP
jgi:hypothetical protein